MDEQTAVRANKSTDTQLQTHQLAQSFHVYSLLWVLSDVEFLVRGVEQVLHLLVVHLQVAHRHHELGGAALRGVLVHGAQLGRDLAEQVVVQQRYYALAVVCAHHGERLASAGLSICEDCAVEAVQCLCHDWLAQISVNLWLCRVCAITMIESKVSVFMLCVDSFDVY